MSLMDLGIEVPFNLPESPTQLANDHPDLADFLNNLQRPIGQISPGEAPNYTVEAEVSEEQLQAFDGIASISRLHRSHQEHELGVFVSSGFTEFGDRSVSLLSTKRNQHGFHQASNLILTEGRFLFGHTHTFKYLSRLVLVEHAVKPMKSYDLDSFNVMHHRAKAARELLRIAS